MQHHKQEYTGQMPYVSTILHITNYITLRSLFLSSGMVFPYRFVRALLRHTEGYDTFLSLLVRPSDFDGDPVCTGSRSVVDTDSSADQ